MKGTIENIQTLRALAALSVVFLHTTSWAGLDLYPSFGNFGVDIFFVISGFIIASITESGTRNFFLKRLIRIVPVYWGATFAIFALALVAPRLLHSTEASMPLLLHSLFFIPYAHGDGGTSPLLKLGWTLNYEMYFYAVFWLAMRLSHRYRVELCFAMIAVVVLADHLSGSSSPAVMFYSDPIVFEFALGMLTSRLLSGGWKDRHHAPVPIVIGAIGVALAWMAAIEVWMTPVDPGLTGRVIYFGIPAFIVVLGAVYAEQSLDLRIGNRSTRTMGDASYILYLIHPYIVFGLIRVVLRSLPLNAAALDWAVLVPAMLVATSLIAAFLHLRIEAPLLRLLTATLLPNRPYAAGGPTSTPSPSEAGAPSLILTSIEEDTRTTLSAKATSSR